MKTCPVCKRNIPDGTHFCANCGFDDSCNYEAYLTLSQVPSGTRSLAGRAKPGLDAGAFWRGRLEMIATKYVPSVYYRPNIPRKHLQKAIKAMPKLLKVCGNTGLRGTGDLHPGADGTQGIWNVTEYSILGMICAGRFSSLKLFVTQEAVYIESSGKRGFLALGYRNIADAKVIRDSGFGHQKLKVLLKDGSIHLCAFDSGANDYLRFDALAEALLALRKYYE